MTAARPIPIFDVDNPRQSLTFDSAKQLMNLEVHRRDVRLLGLDTSVTSSGRADGPSCRRQP